MVTAEDSVAKVGRFFEPNGIFTLARRTAHSLGEFDA